MRATHRDAENRYTKVRQAALELASTYFPTISGLELCLINDLALHQSKNWKQNAARRVDWDWQEGYRTLSFRHPKRFELAIWHNGELISLSIGRPTYRCGSLRLDFLEASEENRSVKVLPIVLVALTAYAVAINVDEIRLVQPINETVKKYYESAGMHYVAKGDYLAMKIERG